MIAHWSDYSDPSYLAFVDEAKPEVAQVGFYGAHFWSLVDTPFGSEYPAHFPVRGHRECGDWFAHLNQELHQRGVKVVGHMNLKFLVGDPESPEGPRGFFRFYRDQWDEKILGPKPVADPMGFLEIDKTGKPIVDHTYKIGGMAEYWACLNNPHWRAVLKAWIRAGIARGVDGFVANYFYRHDCHCSYCVAEFRRYLADRFSAAELDERFGIKNLSTHHFDEIVSWHEPAQSTPLRREMLRFSQVANKEAFDEVFIAFGRSIKPDLLVAQWNHLGDFSQINGDERCFLPDELWGRGEDYLSYSTGDWANYTDLPNGQLGEATLQARFIRGAFDDKPFTIGKYESTRVRVAIAELAANGGAPMGFYTNFKAPEARREIVRYYRFIRAHEAIFRANQPVSEVLLLFPRRQVHQGDLAALDRFKNLGKRLLDAHVLFDVLPNDKTNSVDQGRYLSVIDPSDPKTDLPQALAKVSARSSHFEAPNTIRVSASRPQSGDGITLHFVNYNRHEPSGKKNHGSGIKDEKPIASPELGVDYKLPVKMKVHHIRFMSPEIEEARDLAFTVANDRIQFRVPEFLVYALVQIEPLANAHAAEGQLTNTSRKKVAGVVTVYRHNSHADVILSRLLKSDTLDGKGRTSPLQLASLYVDQKPAGDMSAGLANQFNFRLSDTINDALTLGTGRLAVDGVFLIAEHGDYPRSATGNIEYPKRRFWEEILKVFKSSGRVVPVFIDKHLADNWADAKFIYDSARELNVPLMAGSSLPTSWRRPPADVRRGAKLREIVAITYHTTDAYGFHALEFVQALAEQRLGGETGIKAVQSFSGEAVWRAFEEKKFDLELFDSAWQRLSYPENHARPLREMVRQPKLFRIEYADGLRAHLLELNGAAGEWSAAWRYADDNRVESTLFWTQEGRPAMHFAILLQGIEKMMLTGKPTWNVQRTLLTSGALDALLLSLTTGERRIETPYLEFNYQTNWRWNEPPAPPPTRPWSDE